MTTRRASVSRKASKRMNKKKRKEREWEQKKKKTNRDGVKNKRRNIFFKKNNQNKKKIHFLCVFPISTLNGKLVKTTPSIYRYTLSFSVRVYIYNKKNIYIQRETYTHIHTWKCKNRPQMDDEIMENCRKFTWIHQIIKVQKMDFILVNNRLWILLQ